MMVGEIFWVQAKSLCPLDPVHLLVVRVIIWWNQSNLTLLKW